MKTIYGSAALSGNRRRAWQHVIAELYAISTSRSRGVLIFSAAFAARAWATSS
jgi:hypothetical protein